MAKEKKKKENQAKADELKELLQRTQASFENFRKQSEKGAEDLEKFAAREMVEKLLPIIDNFDLAIRSIEGDKNEFVTGIELIYSQLKTVLKETGVEEINAENVVFDPFLHEALMKIDSDLPENTVVEVFQKGYKMHGLVLRHARVKISTGKTEEKK